MDSHHKQAHGESLKRVSVECDGCGDSFEKYRDRYEQADRHYCSNNCRKDGKVVECGNCGDEIYRNRRKLEKRENHFCSVECHNEWQSRNKIEFECETCGEIFKWSPSRVKQHDPTYCSIQCRNEDEKWVSRTSLAANKTQQEKTEPTAVELEGREILEQIGVHFHEQEPIGGKFCVDVLIPEFDVIIQWDGDYWHCHPKYENPDERQLERKRIDKSQNCYFKECGYTVLRFWGSDIRKNPEGVKSKIERVLENKMRDDKPDDNQQGLEEYADD